MFALELGRALAERGLPETGEDIPVPDAVEDLLGIRVARLPRPTRRLLLAVALSGDLRVSEVEAFADPVAVEDAIEAGRPAPRPGSSAAIAPAACRGGEETLAGKGAAGTPPRARGRSRGRAAAARHLALATQHPDAELADTVAAAAAAAAVRGAVQDAVSLAEHALRLTPPGTVERSDRVLALADYLDVAGESQRLSDLLLSELDSLPGARRASARSCSCSSALQASPRDPSALEQALVESGGDPALRAHVLAKMSIYATTVQIARIREAESWALEALSQSHRTGPDVERLALTRPRLGALPLPDARSTI